MLTPYTLIHLLLRHLSSWFQVIDDTFLWKTAICVLIFYQILYISATSHRDMCQINMIIMTYEWPFHSTSKVIQGHTVGYHRQKCKKMLKQIQHAQSVIIWDLLYLCIWQTYVRWISLCNMSKTSTTRDMYFQKWYFFSFELYVWQYDFGCWHHISLCLVFQM